MSEQEASSRISFHFNKTSKFQTLHADGVFVSTTPSNYGFLAFYTERSPIPKRVDQELLADGSLGNVVDIESKEGVFREIHTGLTMNIVGLLTLKQRVEMLIENLQQKDA